MFRSATVGILLVSLGLFLFGCSPLSRGQGGTGYRDLILDAGEAPLQDVYTKSPRILDRYLYEIIREEESSLFIYFETRWQHRPPFEDEKKQGAVDARTRLTVEARLRRAAATAGASNLYTVKIVAENMVLPKESTEWGRIPNTDEYKAYVGQIAKDLENEFRLSIRRF